MKPFLWNIALAFVWVTVTSTFTLENLAFGGVMGFVLLLGIRRALGATKRTIITQFVLEATLVSGVGGALGTVVGLGGAKVVSLVTPLAATVRPLTVLFGVLFAALVGLVFGIWPAARAANLDPVEALRDE